VPPDLIHVEVACALPDRQWVGQLDLPAGSTVADAVRLSGVFERFPSIDPSQAKFGIFGRRVEPGFGLAAGDRVEVYRPLQVDPKQARRQRAKRTVSRQAAEAGGEPAPGVKGE
jgi:putative ubiquitin-RnfH superfamily antitoxin RatB of RatAB toxin-antitoxin module